MQMALVDNGSHPIPIEVSIPIVAIIIGILIYVIFSMLRKRERQVNYLKAELELCKASKGPFKKITSWDVQREIDRENVER